MLVASLLAVPKVCEPHCELDEEKRGTGESTALLPWVCKQIWTVWIKIYTTGWLCMTHHSLVGLLDDGTVPQLISREESSTVVPLTEEHWCVELLHLGNVQ